MSWHKEQPDPNKNPLVMHVVDTIEPGGMERFLCRLVRRLTEAGMKQVVCTLRGPGTMASTIGGDVRVIPLHVSARRQLAFLKLARLVRHVGADVVHARNWGTWTDAVLAAKRVSTAKWLLGFHGLQTDAGFTRKQRLRAHLLGMHKHTMVAVSQASRMVLVQNLGCDPARIHVVPNGVDLSRYQPTNALRRARARAKLGLPENDYVIGNVGNFFSSVKGHALLIDAFAKVVPHIPRSRLVLVGFGPLLEENRAAAVRQGLGDCVVFAGGIEDVSEILPAFDVYVCPSSSEGMSNAVLEAMATALPCVVTNVSDHHRMFADVGPDCIVEPQNVHTMAAALQRFAVGPELRVRLGCRVRRIVEQEYDFERSALEYCQLYRATATGTGWGNRKTDRAIDSAQRKKKVAAELVGAADPTCRFD